MIKAKLIIVFLATYLFTGAQQFEVLYDYSDFSQEGNTIKKSSAGYFTLHSAYDIDADQFNTVIAKFSENGSLGWNTDLSNSEEIFSQSQSGFAILNTSTVDSYFVIGNYHDSIISNAYPFLIKINAAGEHLGTLLLSNLDYLNFFTYGGVYTDYGIYLIGRSSVDHPNNEVTLIHCDSEGNYIWHVGYAQGHVASIQFIADGGSGILVGGFYYETVNDQTNDYTKQFISRFRYNDGLRLWTSVYSVPQYACYGAVNTVNLPNSNFLFMGNTRAGGGRQPLLGEINRINGDTIWTRTYLHPDTTNWPHNFKRLSNGDYLVVGEAYYDVIPEGWFGVDNVAFMMRLDSGYNLLWKHIYYPEDYAQADWSNAYCRLNDFIENDDGSITALGMVFTYTGDGPQSGFVQDSYLIRVDSEGCLIEGCNEVGIARLEQTNELNIYPNPANEQLNIQFPHIDKWQVSIYNMQGASVREESANQMLQYSVDIHELPSGIYTVLCKDHKGMVLSEKVVKQ